MSTGSPVQPAEDSWVAAIHGTPAGGWPLGSGAVIDKRRVLTCAHVVLRGADRESLWVAFPFADPAESTRRQVQRIIVPGDGELDEDRDVAVLVLTDAVPAGVRPARLKCPVPKALVGTRWWAFGFPSGQRRGNTADGIVGAALPVGWIRIDTDSRYRVEPGFSGGGLWSPDYEAVVGVVAEADDRGNGTAITIHLADTCLPEAGLRLLAERSLAADAGEQALMAWGWSLGKDPEGRRHWRPRARGVSIDSERGYRFRGRTAALLAIKNWLDRPVPDRRALVVTGAPGSGKSAVLGRIVTTADPDTVRELPSGDTAVRATAGSVACAVHAKGKTTLEIATEIARAASAALPVTLDDFAPALRDALADRGGRKFNVIIDALDEAADARSVIARVILPVTETFADVGAQVVVGSRRSDSDGDLLAAIGASREIVDLDDAQFFAAADLTAYALATLQLAGDERPENPYASAVVAGPVAARIADLSDGNFLIAGLTARTHGIYDDQAVDAAELLFTATVDAAMREYMRRCSPLAGVPADTFLTALAFAEAPGLTASLWRTAIRALGAADIMPAEVERFARSSAANFLVESSGEDGEGPVFRLFHQALSDALLHARAQVAARADDERAITGAFIAIGQRSDWRDVPGYLLRCLPAHAARARMADDLLIDDNYLLHADLSRLLPAADRVTSQEGRQRARLVRLTPRANSADPATRVALFSVTEALEKLGDSYIRRDSRTAYRAVWAAAVPSFERSVLEGHTDTVRSVCAFTSSGRALLATGSDDRTVRIWDPATGTQLAVLHGHTLDVMSVCAFDLGDRTLLATGGGDPAVRIWDPVTATQWKVLNGHASWVNTVCSFTADGRTRLASGDADGTIRIWDPATGTQRCKLDGHNSRVNAVCAFTADGRTRLASGGDDGTVRIWDPAMGTEEHVLEGHTYWVLAICAFAAQDGRILLATGDQGGTVRIWDTATWSQDRVLDNHPFAVNGLCSFVIDDRVLLATCGGDWMVRIWDPATGAKQCTLESPVGYLVDICPFILDGDVVLLAAASDDGTVRIWDPDTDMERLAGPWPKDWIKGVHAFTLGGSGMLATVSLDGTVQTWDLATHATRTTIRNTSGFDQAVCPIALDGRPMLAAVDSGGRARIWDLASGAEQVALDGGSGDVAALCSVTHKGRTLLAAGGRDKTIRIWDPVSRQQQSAMQPPESIHALCGFTLADRPVLAIGGSRSARIWDLATGTEQAVLSGLTHEVKALCPMTLGDRTLLAIGGHDKKARIWDPATATQLAVLDGHTDTVQALCAFTLEDRTLLASGSYDRTVMLWDPARAVSLATIPAHHAVVALDYASGMLFIGTTAGLLVIRLSLDTLAPTAR